MGEERARVEPVVAALAGTATVSIDTSKAEVARAALDAGASIVNDVTALRHDPEIGALCAERGATLVLMHMQGDPRTMQEDPRYDDVVDDVKAFLAERMEVAVAAGVAEERIWLDPGIGFGKTSTTTSSCCAGSASCARSGGRWWSAPRARASSARSTARRWAAARRHDRLLDPRRRRGRRRAARPRRRRGGAGDEGGERDPR